jgi:predicted nuclease of predicted toxin-antitoxin system
MRFKTDENLPLAICEMLRSAGHDAASVHEQSLVGRPDPDIAAVCLAEKRAIVTLDLDFADIRTYPPASYAGLVVLRLSSQDREHVVAVCAALLPMFGVEVLDGALWIVEDLPALSPSGGFMRASVNGAPHLFSSHSPEAPLGSLPLADTGRQAIDCGGAPVTGTVRGAAVPVTVPACGATRSAGFSSRHSRCFAWAAATTTSAA